MTEAERAASAVAWVVSRKASRPRALASILAAADECVALGKPDVAVALYRRAAEAGDHCAVGRVVNWTGVRDGHEAVEAVYRAAIAAGDLLSLTGLANVRARQGDTTEGRQLYLQAIDAGVVWALTGYAAFLSNYGDPGETGRAIEQCRRQVAAGDTRALALLGALLLTQSGGEAKAEAEALLRHGAALLENRCRSLLAALLLERGTVGEAAELLERLQATGDEYVRAYAEALADEYDL